MVRRKLTPKILEEIEYYAEDQYTLENTFNKLNISKDLIKEEEVIEAHEKGLLKLYISLASIGLNDEEINNNVLISIEQCELWREQYYDEIKRGLQDQEAAEKNATRQFSNLTYSGMINIIEQNGKDMRPISEQVLYDDIEKMVKEIQNGDIKILLTILTTNIMQLQLFNGTVTRNLMGDLGKDIDNFNMLSNMQLKVMQETRKSIMVINEITNPKRTTFIKEANQHNHLHQNSEKNDENKNELQKILESEQPNPFIESKVIPINKILK